MSNRFYIQEGLDEYHRYCTWDSIFHDPDHDDLDGCGYIRAYYSLSYEEWHTVVEYDRIKKMAPNVSPDALRVLIRMFWQD